MGDKRIVPSLRDKRIVPSLRDKCIMPAMKVPAGYSYHHHIRITTYDSDGNTIYHYSEKAEQELVMRKKSGSHDKEVYSLRRHEHHSSTSSGHSSSGGGSKTTKITNFSHNHSLYKYKFLEEDKIICDICGTEAKERPTTSPATRFANAQRMPLEAKERPTTSLATRFANAQRMPLAEAFATGPELNLDVVLVVGSLAIVSSQLKPLQLDLS